MSELEINVVGGLLLALIWWGVVLPVERLWKRREKLAAGLRVILDGQPSAGRTIVARPRGDGTHLPHIEVDVPMPSVKPPRQEGEEDSCDT